jgi:hypothetical protein
MKRALYVSVYVAAMTFVLWLAVAGGIWQVRNPLGNSTTFWTNFQDAMCLRRVPQYQVKP